MEEQKTYFEDENGKIEKIVSVRVDYLSKLADKKYDLASETLVKFIRNRNWIYTTKDDNKPEIYIYKDGIYVPEGKSEIEEQLRKELGANFNNWIVKQVLDKIKADTYIEPQEFFKEGEPFEIPVLNGLLNLKEIELKPFDRNKIYFSKLPVHFDIDATCPKIDKFLKEVLSSEEDISVFYEIAGLSLVKDYFMEKAIMFVGNGRNGKGKSMELLKRLVGVNNCASVSLSSMVHDSPFISNLHTKLLNLAGDLSSKDLKETGMFKQLTGRDLISANRKYKNILTFKNYAKLVFACNELPKVYDYSQGFWERWILLDFPYYFADKDLYESTPEDKRKNWKLKNPNIIEEITMPMEMSGFLNSAIAGLQRLIKNKRFSYTKGTTEVKNNWIRKADSFMAFCMDYLEESYDSKISKSEIRRMYLKYCKKHKVSGVSDKSIKVTLQELFGVVEEYCEVFGSNKQEYHWVGIKFKEILHEN